MSVNFPNSLDTLTTDVGSSSNPLSSPSHVTAHTKVAQAIEALEAKVGVNSSAVTTTLDYKVTSSSQIDPGHKHTISSLSVTGSPSSINYLRGDGTWNTPPAIGVWGGGSDGTVLLDGTNTYAFFTKVSSTYTLTRDIFCTTFTVNNGITVVENGYAIYANGSIVNAGTIHNNGSNGSQGVYQVSNGTGGAGGGAGTFTGGTAGANGGNSGTNGGASKTCLGTTGGNGGNSGNNFQTGGGAGTATAETVLMKPIVTSVNLTAGSEDSVTELYRLIASTNGKSLSTSAGSGGGGSAGGDMGAPGGGGSGGVVFLAAPTITNTGSITSNGGNGANGIPCNTIGTGGGGGGAGGTIFLIYKTLTAGTITASAGSKGTGGVGSSYTGADGTNGTAGKIYKVKITNTVIA